MGYRIFFIAMCIALLSSCNKETSSPGNAMKANAEIIDFRADKCGCCWGWVIRMGGDTIKVDSLPDIDAIGYNISSPIPVYVELGNIKEDCSSMPAGDQVRAKNYYVLKKLEIVR